MIFLKDTDLFVGIHGNRYRDGWIGIGGITGPTTKQVSLGQPYLRLGEFFVNSSLGGKNAATVRIIPINTQGQSMLRITESSGSVK